MATVREIYREALLLIGDHDIVDENEVVSNRFALDISYENAVQYCMSLGWWRFAFATTTPTLVSTTLPGYTRQFAKPADWLRTHSVVLLNGTRAYPVDWYEEGSNIAVKFTSGIYLKYVQNDIAPGSWPEVFAKLVAAYLAFEVCERITQSRSTKGDIYKIFQERLELARLSESNAPPLRLAEHTIERATRSLLEEGLWKFAMKTTSLASAGGTPSVGYSYRFTRPADWLRTARVFRQSGTQELDIDFRDEAGFLHADYAPIVIRYLSTDAINPSTAGWTELFTAAWMALLRVREAELMADEREIQTRLLTYRAALKEAMLKDAMNERPKVHKYSAFAAARRTGYSGEQAT